MTTTSTTRGDRAHLWNRDFITMNIVNLLMYVPIFMLNTSLAGYVTSLHGGAGIAGTAAGVFAVTAFIGYLVAGPVLDRGDRRTILALALFLMAIAIAGYAVFGTITGIILFRLLQGFGLAFATTAFLVVVTKTLPADRITEGIRYFTLVMVIGQAIGPAIGLDLAAWIGFRGLFITDATLMAMGGALVFTIRGARRSSSDVERRTAGRRFVNPFARQALPAGLVLFLTTLAFFIVSSFLIVYAESRGIGTSIGYFFCVYAVTLLVVNPLVSCVMPRVGVVPVLITSLALQGAALLELSVAGSLWQFFLAAVLLAAGYGVSMPLIKGLAMAATPTEHHGAASATSNLGVDLGTLVGGSLGGLVVAGLGYSGLWTLMVIPVIVAIVVVILLRGTFIRAARAETAADPAPTARGAHSADPVRP